MQQLIGKDYSQIIVNEMLTEALVVFDINNDFKILELNNKFLELVKYSAEEINNLFSCCLNKLISRNDLLKLERFLGCIEDYCENRYIDLRIFDSRGRLRQVDMMVHKISSTGIFAAKISLTKDPEYNCDDLNDLMPRFINKTFFCADITSNRLFLSENFADKLGVPVVINSSVDGLLNFGVITQHSSNLLRSAISSPEEFIDNDNVIHFILANKSDAWYKCKYKGVFEGNKLVRVISELEDITDQYLKIKMFKDQARKDLLTGLYNKKTIEYKIENRLNESDCQPSAMFMVDIDCFKAINDKYGHLYGDAVVTQIGDSLKRIFSSKDLLGRVGGDEFMVFMCGYSDIEQVISKAKELCCIFREKAVNENDFSHISVSIGISLFPNDGNDFKTLYDKADKALYNAKAYGKACFKMFS